MKRLILLTWLIILGVSVVLGQNPPANPASADTTLSAKVDSLSARIGRLQWRLDSLEIVKGQREECLQDAHEYLDRSLSTLNTILVIVGILVAGIALIVTIVGNRVQERTSRFERLQFDLERQRDQLIRQQETLGRSVEDATKEFARITSIREQAEQEKDKLSKTMAAPLLREDEELSDQMRQKLDELAAKMREVEKVGGSLKAEDYFNRGVDQYYKDFYDSALLSFESAIELKADYTAAWANRGVTFGRLNRWDDCLRSLEQAIAQKPDDAFLAWANKGIALSKLERYEESVVAYNVALDIEPGDFRVHSNKASSLIKLKLYESAIEACNAALKIKGEYALAYFNRACAYSLMKKKTESLADLKRATEIDQKMKEAAMKEEDFKDYWGDEEFKKIVGE